MVMDANTVKMSLYSKLIILFNYSIFLFEEEGLNVGVYKDSVLQKKLIF